jgi:hypothetical protein
MNKKQKRVLINFFLVIIGTFLFVGLMILVRDNVNRTEGIRVMERLGEKILDYKKDNHALPPRRVVDDMLEGIDTRLGSVEYRAPWIMFDSPGETILAYSFRPYAVGFAEGYIVLRLDGTVEWMDTPEFRKLLGKQQSEAEIKQLKSVID